MSKDLYGAVNRHYGSEPDTERDEDLVTMEALSVLQDHGMCPFCNAGTDVHPFIWDAWVTFHAETCTPLRERVVAQRERDRE